MGTNRICISLAAFLLLMALGPSEGARVFTIINECKTTIWPAVTPGANFDGGGFELKSGQSVIFNAPVGWSGRLWGRTGCSFDNAGKGSCETGSCGDSLQCGMTSGDPPATLVELTLGARDFYDVSLVDGFNLPVVVTTVHGTGNCSTAGCDGDLRQSCPPELAVKGKDGVVACRSACDVFDTDEYCCIGMFGNPSTCQPTNYSKLFKSACPASYSYAYDDPTSIFICVEADYTITFCSSRKQPVCTYHDTKLTCSAASKIGSLVLNWVVSMITLSIPSLWFFL